MILEKDIFKIGKFIKPHGIKGELVFAFDQEVLDQSDCKYLICPIDGIFVPFFIESYRFKSNETALILLEDINNEDKARRLCGIDVYFPRQYYIPKDSEDYTWNFFIGFNVVDSSLGNIGEICEVDDKTINILFLIQNNGKEYIMPAAEEFIEEIDSKNKIIKVNLPEGLLE